MCEASRKLERLHKGTDIWVVKLDRLFVSRSREGDITVLLFEIVWVYHWSLERIVGPNVLQNRDRSKYSALDEER